MHAFHFPCLAAVFYEESDLIIIGYVVNKKYMNGKETLTYLRCDQSDRFIANCIPGRSLIATQRV